VLEEKPIEPRLVLEVHILLPAPCAVQRRLGDVQVTALDELGHLSVEESEEQRTDMTAVDVGVCHQDDLVVPKLLDIEAPLPDAAAERGDESPDLGAREHFVETSPLDVQYLSAERQDCLKPPVATLLRRTAGAVALDDVDLRLIGIARLAVGELSGERRIVELALAHDLARLACSFPRLCREDGLFDDFSGRLRVLFEEPAEPLIDGRLDNRLDLARDKLALGLRIEARVGVLDADDSGEPLANVLSLQAVLYLFEEILRGAIAIEHLGERRPQTGEVRAAIPIVDVVRVAEYLFGVARVPLHRELNAYRRRAAIDHLLCDDRDHLVVHRILRLVQMFDELLDAPFVLEILLPPAFLALVRQRDEKARIEKRQLAQTAGEHVVLKVHHGKDHRVGLERNLGARLIAISNHRERGNRRSTAKLLEMHMPLPFDLHF
jgi:hypothetical protein